MKLLIVDDQEVNRDLLRATLEPNSFEFEEATDGAEALKILEHEKIDAVISDILMPNMDGYRLCKEVRHHAKLFSVPIVLYTSTYTSTSDLQFAFTAGADAYLMKPAPLTDLLTALNDAMQKSKARTHKPSKSSEEETSLMSRYNDVLVKKLEARNLELERSAAKLQEAQRHILELNMGLEQRVKERTLELERKNLELEAALAQVKELSGLLPICAWCKKIRDEANYWQAVDIYITRHTHAEFTHGICPECFDAQLKRQPKMGKS